MEFPNQKVVAPGSIMLKTYVSVILGMKTEISEIVGLFPLCEYTECVALICQGEWVFPLTFPFIGLLSEWGAQSVNSSKIPMATKKKKKKKQAKNLKL